MATARNRLGRLRTTQNREQEALELQRQALEDVRDAGDVLRTAVMLRDFGEALMGTGRPAEAADAYEQALGLPDVDAFGLPGVTQPTSLPIN